MLFVLNSRPKGGNRGESEMPTDQKSDPTKTNFNIHDPNEFDEGGWRTWRLVGGIALSLVASVATWFIFGWAITLMTLVGVVVLVSLIYYKRPLLGIAALLLLAASIAVYSNVLGSYDAASRLVGGHHVAQAAAAVQPPAHDPPKVPPVAQATPASATPPPVTPVSGGGKDCKKQETALLAKAREETLAKAKAEASDMQKHHRITAADVGFIATTITTFRGGDGKKVDVLDGLVKWNIKVPSGAIFHFRDKRHVCICHEWHVAFTPPPVVRRASVTIPVVKSDCNAFHVDGRGYPVKQPLEVTLQFYQHGGSANDQDRAVQSGCFYAIDGKTGKKLYLHVDCVGCSDGTVQEVWPLDVVVGRKATLIASFVCPSGYCTFYQPADWVREVSMLACFTAREPYFSPDGWKHSDYFDRVSVSSALSRGSFRRVIKPTGVLGGDDLQVGLAP
jgi:hypothetical protein